MKKGLFRNIVFFFFCIAILSGYASICNAYSIAPGSSVLLESNCATSGYYSYSVSYVYYYGLPVGVYLSGLEIYMDDVYFCAVDRNQRSGFYCCAGNDMVDFWLHNNTGRQVIVDLDFYTEPL